MYYVCLYLIYFALVFGCLCGPICIYVYLCVGMCVCVCVCICVGQCVNVFVCPKFLYHSFVYLWTIVKLFEGENMNRGMFGPLHL
jgi:hypothetical protein